MHGLIHSIHVVNMHMVKMYFLYPERVLGKLFSAGLVIGKLKLISSSYFPSKGSFSFAPPLPYLALIFSMSLSRRTAMVLAMSCPSPAFFTALSMSTDSRPLSHEIYLAGSLA